MSKPEQNESRSLNPSWPIWVIGLASAAIGALGAAYLMTSYYSGVVAEGAHQATTLKARVAILEVALNQAQPYVIRLEADQGPATTPPPSVTAEPLPGVAIAPAQQPVMPAPAAASPVTAPATPVTQPAPKPVSPPVQAQPARPAQVQPQAVTKPQAQAPASVAQQPTPPVAANPATPAAAKVEAAQAPVAQAVTQEEITAAMKGKIEGVTAAKAGVKRLYLDGVEFVSGRIVRRGEIFPSGEKLLSVDPSTGRIITNQRQLIVFFEN
jgi:hypothetical protein